MPLGIGLAMSGNQNVHSQIDGGIYLTYSGDELNPYIFAKVINITAQRIV